MPQLTITDLRNFTRGELAPDGIRPGVNPPLQAVDDTEDNLVTRLEGIFIMFFNSSGVTRTVTFTGDIPSNFGYLHDMDVEIVTSTFEMVEVDPERFGVDGNFVFNVDGTGVQCQVMRLGTTSS